MQFPLFGHSALESCSALGEILFFFANELADLTFGKSFQFIMTALIDNMCAIFQPTKEQLTLFLEIFIDQLLEYIRNSLVKAALPA